VIRLLPAVIPRSMAESYVAMEDDRWDAVIKKL